MDLAIRSIHEQGKANSEYVLIDVLGDCNLKYYCIADTTYIKEGAISNKLRHFYWWSPKTVNKGEMIVLMTGVGTNDTYKNTNGTTIHRFYWGLKSAVWNNSGDAGVLFNISTWNTTKAA